MKQESSPAPLARSDPSRRAETLRRSLCPPLGGRFVAVLAVVATLALAECASTPAAFRQQPPIPANQPTTPSLLGYLIEQAAAYQLARADAEVIVARGPVMSSDPGVNLGSAIAYRGAVERIEKLDTGWRFLLMDMLGNAPTAKDFDLRQTALGLTSEEVKPYLEIWFLKTEKQ